jgi:hypothetical protein
MKYGDEMIVEFYDSALKPKIEMELVKWLMILASPGEAFKKAFSGQLQLQPASVLTCNQP